MKKIGFVVKVKSKGKEYFYIRKSIWEKKENGKSTSKPKNIMALGNKCKAIDSLSFWAEHLKDLPEELKGLNLRKEDILQFIDQIEEK